MDQLRHLYIINFLKTFTTVVKYQITLVGGNSSTNGNVFSTNPITGFYGPVCDDGWDLIQVTLNLSNRNLTNKYSTETSD
jgi:hypothetical protein